MALLPSHLCLDAPLVAVSWSVLLARSAGGLVHWPNQTGLFCAVWWIYLADRLYDVRKSSGQERHSLRHRFAERHRKLLAGAIILATLGGIASAPFLKGIDWRIVAALVLGVTIYFFLFRLMKHLEILRAAPLKEISIGFCFAISVFLTAGVEITQASIGILVSLSILFLANCLLISMAEREEDAKTDPAAFFSQPGKWPERALGAVFFLCWILVIGAVMRSSSLSPEAKRVIGISYGLALGGLVVIRSKMETLMTVSQPLADAVLLSPVPVMLVAIILKSFDFS